MAGQPPPAEESLNELISTHWDNQLMKWKRAIFELGILLLAGVAWASTPPSSVTITESSGSAQTSRTVIIPRYFAKGEITNYAKPAVAGQTIALWQNDVKNRWRDGKATATITGCTNAYPIVCTAANHGFQTGEWVTISGVGGNTAANGYWRIYRLNKDKFFIRATGNGTYTSGGTASGPGYGSLRFAVISLVVPSISANSSITVTFADSANPCSSGDSSACSAAALDANGMLNFLSGAWDAKIKATQGNTVTVSARTMLSNGHFTYWMRGPVATVVIAEDLSSSRSYDFGWTCTASCSADYASATWSTDSTHKSLHPRFTLWFYPADGTPKVRSDYVVENMWSTHMQDQRYSVVLTKGTGDTQVYSKTAFPHYAGARWRKGGHLLTAAWQPVAPGAANMKLGMEYVVYSGAVPAYDMTFPIGSTEITQEVSDESAEDFDINGAGHFTKYLPTAGGRVEIGIFPRWQVRWLYTQDAALYRIMLENGDVSGYVPFHMRESSTSANVYLTDYDRDGTSNGDGDDNITGNSAFGKIISVDARPDARSSSTIASVTTPVATLSSSHGWTVDQAHQASFAYMPYLVTGDPYYLEEIQFWAAGNLFSGNPGSGATFARHGSYGIIPYDVQTRGMAWAYRTFAHAVVTSPDGSAEKDYFLAHFDNNMSLEEGDKRISNGAYFFPMSGGSESDPCPSAAYNADSYALTANTPYCTGVRTVNVSGPSPLGIPDLNDEYAGIDSAILDPAAVYRANAPWMIGFKVMVLGHIRELGLPVDAVADQHGRYAIGIMGHPSVNPLRAVVIRAPSLRVLDHWYFQSWDEYATAFSATCQADQNMDNTCADDYEYVCPFCHGHIVQMAASFFTHLRVGLTNGQAAYDWAAATLPNQESTQDGAIDPVFAARPRRDPTRMVSVRPGSTSVLLSYVAPTGDACTVKVDDASNYSSPLVNTSDGGTTRSRQFLATGLSASTPYYYRITCTKDLYNQGNTDGQFTSKAAGGATTIQVSLSTPSGLSIDNAVVDYGSSSSLDSSTSAVSCANGCSLSVPATSGVALYYRWRYRTSGGSDVLTSETRIWIP